MRKGWEIKKLGDVCNKASSNVSQNQLDNEVGEYSIFGASGFIKNVSFYHQDKPYLSIVKDGSGVGRITKMDAFTSVIGTLQYILPNEGIDLDYLNYSLMSVDFKKYVAGAAIPHIYFKDYKNEPFLWMPLSEQKRIVAILDEAFSAIDKAKANTEKNLQNAKELFESYLQGFFENRGEGWEEKTIGEMCDLIDSLHKTPKYIKSGGFPMVRVTEIKYGNLNISGALKVDEETYKEFSKKHIPKIGDIVFSRVGASFGVSSLVVSNDAFCLGQNTVFIISKLNSLFCYYFLNSRVARIQMNKLVAGAAQPTISLKSIKELIISVPSSIQQKDIVQKIEALSIETKKLEAIYQQKLTDLEELKKSILQKAFAGELTTHKATSTLLTNISPTDLQAGIIVLAFQKHKEKAKQNTFHHVKAEKIVNMVQYHLGIELNRNPVKDAAGPNDFPHAKKVESRAAKAGFFTVTKVDGFYNYNIGRQADGLIQKVNAALQEKSHDLIRLIDLMVPMTTQQAEIVATVYAAWNNLLIDDITINDEAIVHEARENWHRDKLKIARDKFFKAIEWMKGKELIPNGTGKKVLAKSA